MDDNADRPASDAVSHQEERDQLARADRLVARLAELREKLEVLAPQDQERGRQAVERIREGQERIATLEALLGSAREREHDLTIQLVRDRAHISEYEGQVSELGTIAARVSSAEEGRREAEGAAVERERALAVAEADLDAVRAEAERLRSRCSELEADLRVVASEMAEATMARNAAARLERERNEARERATTERRLAAADRARAAEAEVRAAELRAQLGAAERRIVQLSNAVREPQTSLDLEEPRAGSEPPWIGLQRANAAPEPVAASEGSPTTPSVETAAPEPTPTVAAERADETEVIDLTVESEPDPGQRDDSAGTEEAGWATASEEGLLDRLLHPRRRH
jgi:chromosome segregation ATPase